MMAESPNIFDWLDQVRERPSMYAGSITDLHWLVRGYYTALRMYNIHEDVPEMVRNFSYWLEDNTQWPNLNSGWGSGFDHYTPVEEDKYEFFFKYVDEYRQLKPTVTARVTLRPEHQPQTDRWWFAGLNERVRRPDEIFVVNYDPTSLNHLRYRFGDRIVDDSFLMLGNGSHETRMSDLFERPFKEFGIDPAEWEILD